MSDTLRRDASLKEQVNVRLSGDARKVLMRLQRHFGVSQAAVLEMLLREKARELGYLPPTVRAVASSH